MPTRRDVDVTHTLLETGLRRGGRRGLLGGRPRPTRPGPRAFRVTGRNSHVGERADPLPPPTVTKGASL